MLTAPPGSGHFREADLGRLSRTALGLVFHDGPGAAPLEDAAAALAGDPGALAAVATAVGPTRGARLRELAARETGPAERSAAAHRLVRGAFWTLVYELEPERWDRLAAAEPLGPALLADLPAGGRVVEVGAGSGRLTGPLAARAATLVAVEPSPPLRRLLRERYASVHVVAGVAHRLPVASGWADVVASCATLGPHPPLGGEPVLAELERCVRPGGLIALVGPEAPEWWVGRGFTLASYPVPAVRLPPDLEAFFGPAAPPRHLLTRRLSI